MRVLFMGTPDFAVASLEAIHAAGQDICGVFTQPDKKQNRGQKVSAPAVKECAIHLGLPVFQPETLRDGTALSFITALNPDIIIVVAYGKLLPQEILDFPKYGCINVHASLLPKYRGAAPIQWAILNGESHTGVTIMQMDIGLDTGDMLTKKETEILPEDTAKSLFLRLQTLGAECLVETLPKIERGEITATPQNHEEATFAPPLSRDLSEVHWEKSAAEIINQIRGLNPWPMATTEIAGRKFKLHHAIIGTGKGNPGEILNASTNGLEIACGIGSIIILTLQAEGKKAMPVGDYLRGNPIA